MKILLLLAGFAQEIPDHPDKIQYPPLRFEVPDPEKMRTSLPNGTVVYALEDQALPLITLQIYIRAGSFWEPKGKEGLAELCGTVLRTGGTKKRMPQQLEEELDFLAAELSVTIGETMGSASISILSKDVDQGLEILFDVLFSPEFRQEKIDLAKAQMMDKLKARNDSPGSIEGREASLLLYGEDFPLNHLPTKASVEGITRKDLQNFHQTHFVPGELIVAAAGNFKREELIAKLKKLLPASPPPRADRPKVPALRFTPSPGAYGFSKEVPQGRVTLAHHGIDLRHPDVHAIRIMNYILGGGGFSSRLMQRVRTDEGLAYDVRSDAQPGIAYLGTFRVQFQSKNESCAYAIQLCLEEIKKICDTPVVIMSGYLPPHKEKEVIQAGALASLKKPLDLSQVFGLIEKALEMKKG